MSVTRVIASKCNNVRSVLRTEIEIFPHDELGAGRAQAQGRQVDRRDAERVHVGRQVAASLSRTRHHVIV